jgi:hypothetical protein
MRPLKSQAPGKVLQPFQFIPQLVKFFLAVEMQSLKLFDACQGRFAESLQFSPGFLFQKIQLEGEDLQRSIHLVNDAQTAAPHAGVAIVTHQFFEAPFQGFIDSGIICGQR